MRPRLTSTFARLRSWISRGPTPAIELEPIRAALQAQVKRGGPGSDLAAATLKGICIAEIALAGRDDRGMA